MAPHSSTLAWKIPGMEEPGRLQSMGSLRVGHDWATSLSLFTIMHWRRKWQPTPVFLPGESQRERSLVGLPSMGSHRVGHNWSDSAAAGRFWLVYSLTSISGHLGLSALKDVGCVWPRCCGDVMEWKQSTLEYRNPRIISWQLPERCSRLPFPFPMHESEKWK